ncbi:hypothetical protein NL676_025465 [Syzygium grande]|nr:hypothetical protein NL676_025465 [Syzygium grande]
MVPTGLPILGRVRDGRLQGALPLAKEDGKSTRKLSWPLMASSAPADLIGVFVSFTLHSSSATMSMYFTNPFL